MKWFHRSGRGRPIIRDGRRLAPPTSLDDARAARAQSEDALSAARQQDPAVRNLARSLREHRHSNNFAGMLETIFRGAQ